MIHLFRVGPIPVIGGYSHLFAGIDAQGLVAKVLQPRPQGGLPALLEMLKAGRQGPQELVAEPELAPAARRLKVQVASAPLPQPLLEARALVAVQVLLERDSEGPVPWALVKAFTQAYCGMARLSPERRAELRTGLAWGVVGGAPPRTVRIAFGDEEGPSVNLIDDELRPPRSPPAVLTAAFPTSGLILGAVSASSEQLQPWSEAVFRQGLQLECVPMMASMRSDARHPISLEDIGLAAAVFQACQRDPAERRVAETVEVDGRPLSVEVYFPLGGPGENDHRVVGLFSRDEPCPCAMGNTLSACHGHYPLDGPLIGAEANYYEKRVLEHGAQHMGEQWLLEAAHLGFAALAEDGGAPELGEMELPWACRDLRVEGTSMLEHYLKARGNRGGPRELAFHRQAASAWPSYLRVTARRDQALDLEDVLTGARWSRVELGRDARQLVPGSVIFAYAGRWHGRDALFDADSQSLAPDQALRVEAALRALLPDPISGLLLRDAGAGLLLGHLWLLPERTVELPPQFDDADWMEVCGATFQPARRREVLSRLSEAFALMPGRDGEAFLYFCDPSFKGGEPRPITGLFRVGPAGLQAYAKTKEAAQLIATRAREAIAELGRPSPNPHTPPPLPRAMIALVRAYKNLAYTRWPDTAGAWLSGRTPRQVQRSPGRDPLWGAVERKLEELSAWEAEQPEHLRLDPVTLMGLPPPSVS